MNQLKSFSNNDIDVLLKAATQDVLPVENMTRDYYFHAVKYAISGIDQNILKPPAKDLQNMQKRMMAKAVRNGLNPNIFMSDDVYAYNKYTTNWVGDAVDNFGSIVSPNNSADFARWFDRYAYNGGHPFEIYPYVCLYVRRITDKFYLELADFAAPNVQPTEKVLKMFLALHGANISVALRDKDLLLQKIQKYNLLNR